MNEFAYTQTLYVHQMSVHTEETCLCCIPRSSGGVMWHLIDENGNWSIKGFSEGHNKDQLEISLRERYYQLVKTEKCPTVAKHVTKTPNQMFSERCAAGLTAGCLCCCVLLCIPKVNEISGCTRYTYRMIGSSLQTGNGNGNGKGKGKNLPKMPEGARVVQKADGSIEIIIDSM